jgi:hypothetical protein
VAQAGLAVRVPDKLKNTLPPKTSIPEMEPFGESDARAWDDEQESIARVRYNIMFRTWNIPYRNFSSKNCILFRNTRRKIINIYSNDRAIH